VQGGVILFRGTGADARRYLESDRGRADEYYLEGGTALANFTAVNAAGEVIGQVGLTPDEYESWVNWANPLTGELLGIPREAGNGRQGSPRFAEMTINVPKSLSIAAALHEDVSEALDAAQADAVSEVRRFLGAHSVTRVGPRGKQEVVPVEQLETVAVVHRTSRHGDPHRHVHFQIGTRVWAAGKWRGLDTAALFKQQGAIRALGTAILAAHPQLASVLDSHGLTLDPVSGEIRELEQFNKTMSKRAAQVKRNFDRMMAEWDAAHPGVEPGPVARSKMVAAAWDHQRPAKKPDTLAHESGWLAELQAAGYTPDIARRLLQRDPVALDELHVQDVANRALDRCAAAASTWTVHTIRENVTRLVTESGVRATHQELREFIEIGTHLAFDGCLSVLPPDVIAPEHVAYLTSVQVVAVETGLRDLITARVTTKDIPVPDVAGLAAERGLDVQQTAAAAAVASTDPLVIVEGAAGAGKTTMLAVAIAAANREGRAVRVLAPTKKAADVARQELGVPADSVAKLVHANGWRWNRDGVWARLTVGQADPDTGMAYAGPPADAVLAVGERVVVDEAGMLDQDTALALFTLAAEIGATIALVGDRAQLPAVGRGGVLDIAAQLKGLTFDMGTVHRFADPEYADLSVQMRAGTNPGAVFDRLNTLGLVRIHRSVDAAHRTIAIARADTNSTAAVTVATNEQAAALNERIRDRRVTDGKVDGARTVTGMDGLPISAGDLIQTRKNDAELRVANRQTWTVQHVADDGTVWASEAGRGPNMAGRKGQLTVKLPQSYVAAHAHLAYAVTAYGVQGSTVKEAHTLLGAGPDNAGTLDGAGVYVGMTRGRQTNILHIVAGNTDEAREQFATAFARDRADRGLETATAQARQAVTGLVDDGPVKLVNTERARLTQVIADADARADRWQHAAGLVAEQTRTHAEEEIPAREALAVAQAHLDWVRTEAIAPLLAEAQADGQAVTAAQERVWAANNAARNVGRMGARSAQRAVEDAATSHRNVQVRVRARWGSAPVPGADSTGWAETAAAKAADSEPAVTTARRHVERAQTELNTITSRHMAERQQLRTTIYGPHRSGARQGTPQQQAAAWRRQAQTARDELARIESLPPAEAARHIQQRQEQQAQAEQAAAEQRAAQVSQASQWSRGRGHQPDRRGPSLGM